MIAFKTLEPGRENGTHIVLTRLQYGHGGALANLREGNDFDCVCLVAVIEAIGFSSSRRFHFIVSSTIMLIKYCWDTNVAYMARRPTGQFRRQIPISLECCYDADRFLEKNIFRCFMWITWLLEAPDDQILATITSQIRGPASESLTDGYLRPKHAVSLSICTCSMMESVWSSAHVASTPNPLVYV